MNGSDKIRPPVNANCNQRMQLSQIYISDSRQPMGKLLEDNAKVTRATFPGMKYKLYGDDDIRDLLASNFDGEVLVAYRSLVPYAYKSDLARFCILHEFDGWYIDIGLRLARINVTIPEGVHLLAFRDILRYAGSSYACAGGVIYARPGHPAIAKAIELILENVKNRYYGVTPFCPTGPGLWGRAIAIVGTDHSYSFGDFMELTPDHPNKNKAMVLPDGSIFAYNKRSAAGDLQALEARGTNNYNDLWQSRSVYLD